MINKDILLGKLPKVEHITFKCDRCKKGTKVVNKKMFFEAESAYSKEEFTDEVNGYDSKIHKRFAVGLICSNPDCNDISIVSGDINSVLELKKMKYNGQLTEAPFYNHRIIIQNITPTQDLFDIENFKFKNSNLDISNELKSAFSVFWKSEDSCAMKIRSFLELLMDDNGIQKFETDEVGKQKENDLYNRIKLFQKKFPNQKLKDKLHNLRIHGNLGSHPSKSLTKEQVVIMIEIVELILFEIYVNNREKLNQLNEKLKNSRTQWE